MTLTAAPELTATIQVGRDAARAARARRKVRALVAGSDSPEYADLAELVVSELVANALRHGAGPVQVRLCRAPGGLRIEVHDEGAGRPVRCHAADYDECGRGLELVDDLITPLGGARGTIDDDCGPGKSVYVVLPARRPAARPAGRRDGSPVVTGA
jgi:anti-sigma regulatory factor (Ser/Thr protein kinase)